MQSKVFSHINEKGNPNMVNITEKSVTHRTARAVAYVRLPEEIIRALDTQKNDLNTPKGSVFQTAIVAGIMGAKKTAQLIPLCHPLLLNKVHLTIQIIKENTIEIISTASTDGKTGVEMEALTAVSVAALTVYDMCKSFSHKIVIEKIELLEKKGGKSDYEK